MKRIFIALTRITTLAVIAAFGATSFMPVHATTFPTPTLIYVAAGVADSNTLDIGTVVSCTNISGRSATVRWSFISQNGTSVGSRTFEVANGRTIFVGTVNAIAVFGFQPVVSTAANFQGRVAVRSTESAVFCSAIFAQSTGSDLSGHELHMVRFNPHPGTVE